MIWAGLICLTEVYREYCVPLHLVLQIANINLAVSAFVSQALHPAPTRLQSLLPTQSPIQTLFHPAQTRPQSPIQSQSLLPKQSPIQTQYLLQRLSLILNMSHRLSPRPRQQLHKLGPASAAPIKNSCHLDSLVLVILVQFQAMLQIARLEMLRDEDTWSVVTRMDSAPRSLKVFILQGYYLVGCYSQGLLIPMKTTGDGFFHLKRHCFG